jgi:hypothetical protein
VSNSEVIVSDAGECDPVGSAQRRFSIRFGDGAEVIEDVEYVEYAPHTADRHEESSPRARMPVRMDALPCVQGDRSGADEVSARADQVATDESDSAGQQPHNWAHNESALAPDGRPVIRPTGGDLPEILSRAQELLRETGSFFSCGNQIVCVVTDPATGEAAIAPTSPAKLSVVLSRAAAWLVKSGRNGELRRVDAPDAYCSKLLKLEHFEHLQPLTGLARQPYLRNDGTIRLEAGYDAVTGLYGVFPPPDFPVVPRPTRADAEAALGRLDALLAEFPFVEDHDRSAALAAMLTAAVRASLPVAPMFLVTAPEAGSGKTFLCQLIAAFASSRTPAPQSFPRSEEEVDKILLAELRSNPPVVFFDNLTEDIRAFQKLCVVLTSERVSGRILRSSNIATVSTRSLLLASGNNVKPSRDMQRRCITIALDPNHEMPASRVFRDPDLLVSVMKRRGEFVADALTIVSAWIGAGSPVTACQALVTYEAWSSWCRQPLLWLGRSDPAQAAFTAMHDDPERQLLQTVLTEWHDAFGSTSVMVRDLVERALSGGGSSTLRDALVDISDQGGDTMNRRRIGRWISRQVGRVAGGFRIESARRTRNAEAWRVVSV